MKSIGCDDDNSIIDFSRKSSGVFYLAGTFYLHSILTAQRQFASVYVELQQDLPSVDHIPNSSLGWKRGTQSQTLILLCEPP